MALKKTLPRERRLQSAKTWIPTYTGKNIAKGYKKHFKLSPLEAVKDLMLLGAMDKSKFGSNVYL
jgi:hypothetical protein